MRTEKFGTEMSTVSVIVPVYRVELEVERCIGSILSQSFSDFELILVNDGSPDRSGAICQAAAQRDSRIRYFEKSNGGLASARNYGLEKATGEYICFADSDDYIEPEALEYCVNKISEVGADMVICGYFMDNDGKTSKIAAPAGIYSGSDINRAMPELKRKNIIDPAWNKLYKREFIEKNGLRFPDGEIYEDTDFNLRALCFSPKVAVFDKCFYHYELHMGSITRRYNPEKLETIKRRALLLKEVTSGIEPCCDYYYIKFVFSAIMDMFLSCGRREIKQKIKQEAGGAAFKAAAANAQAVGLPAAIMVKAARSGSPLLMYCFCRLAYILKFKLQGLFLRVRE